MVTRAYSIENGEILLSTTVRVGVVGGSANTAGVAYDVANGGKLIARNVWYSETTTGRFMRLTGRGAVTLQGGNAFNAVDDNNMLPTIELNGFRGRVTLLNTLLGAYHSVRTAPRLHLSGDGSQTELFGFGVVADRPNFVTDNSSPQARVAVIGSPTGIEGGGSQREPDYVRSVSSQADFIRTHLAHTRSELPQNLRRFPTALRTFDSSA